MNSIIGSTNFTGQTVLVAGYGISGRSVAQILRTHNVKVITVDEKNGQADLDSFEKVAWNTIDLVVVSPVFPPSSTFLQEAKKNNIPIWSEVEFAWKTRAMRPSGGYAPWIGITGTNGKTTTTEMTTAILNHAHHQFRAVGNIGEPVSLAVQDSDTEGFCVELSSFEMHFTSSMHLNIAVWTNIAADHLDWHGGFDNYAADKAKVLHDVKQAIIFNSDDEVVSHYVNKAEVKPGCKKIGFTLGNPHEGQIGIKDGYIYDNSAIETGELIALNQFPQLSRQDGVIYPHLLADILAATAVARVEGIDSSKIVQALQSFTLDAHRIEKVGEYRPVLNHDPIRFIDDSKATNAHAAAASLKSFAPHTVIWVCGGLAKGASFNHLISENIKYMKAAIIIGEDQQPFIDAFNSVTTDIPVISIPKNGTIDKSESTKSAIMNRVINEAMRIAKPGDVVLLAPATASMDQFNSYADRGKVFATAAQEWIQHHE